MANVSTNGLNGHVKNIHTNSWKQDCNICGKTFQSPISYEKHNAIIHGTGKSLSFCDFCGKSFKDRSGLLGHMKHHELEDMLYVCDICEKTFRKIKLLKGHIKFMHNSRREFECKLCNRKFTLKSNMKQHIENIHSGL